MRHALALALAVLVTVTACSSNYMPHSRGRVSIILDTGAPAYVRDGVKYKHGFLGSGLVKAVRGHPQAEAAAREYKDRLGTGLLASLIGLGCMVGSAVSVGVRYENSDPDPPVELWVMLGCMALTFGGLGYTATAEPYRWDAINIFNDAFNPGPAPMPGPYYPAPGPAPGGPPGGAPLLPPAPSTTPPPVTLQMPR